MNKAIREWKCTTLICGSGPATHASLSQLYDRRSLRMRLSEAQNHRCAYCNVVMTDPIDGLADTAMSIDHYQPLTAKGNHHIDNLIVACAKCNNSRGHLSADFFHRFIQEFGRNGADKVILKNRYLKLFRKMLMMHDGIEYAENLVATYANRFMKLHDHFQNLNFFFLEEDVQKEIIRDFIDEHDYIFCLVRIRRYTGERLKMQKTSDLLSRYDADTLQRVSGNLSLIAESNRDLYTTYLRLLLSEQQNHRCAYCQTEMVLDGDCTAPNYVSIDHVVPRAEGGTDCLTNLVAACRLCNNRRGHIPAMLFYRVVQTIGIENVTREALNRIYFHLFNAVLKLDVDNTDHCVIIKTNVAEFLQSITRNEMFLFLLQDESQIIDKISMYLKKSKD